MKEIDKNTCHADGSTKSENRSVERTRAEEKDRLEIDAANSRFHSKIWLGFCALVVILLFWLLMVKLCVCA